MSEAERPRPPSEVRFNRLVRPLVWFGLGPRETYLLRVRGRRSGRVFSVPVNVMSYAGASYVISPRGEVGWVKNLRAAGRCQIRRGFARSVAMAEEVPEAERAVLLKEYLGRYAAATAQYFPLAPDAEEADFAAVAASYPVFVLRPVRS